MEIQKLPPPGKKQNSLKWQIRSTIFENEKDCNSEDSISFQLMILQRENKALGAEPDKMKTELDAWQIRHQALEESHSIAQQTILVQEQEAKQFDEIVICTFWGGEVATRNRCRS